MHSGIPVFLLSLLIFAVLTQMNGMIAVLFLLAALILLPTISIHRREAASMPESVAEIESHGRGVLRLAHLLSRDAIGIATGTLVLILVVLCLKLIAQGVGH